jgi:hypothetical protein
LVSAGRGEAAHIGADLSDQGDGGGWGDAGNSLGQRHRLCERGKLRLDLLLQLRQRSFQEGDVLEQQAQLHQMDGAHPAFQRLA